MIMGGQPLSTINQNCKRTRKVNHYQQLTTIFFAPLVAITAIVNANIVSNLIEDN